MVKIIWPLILRCFNSRGEVAAVIYRDFVIDGGAAWGRGDSNFKEGWKITEEGMKDMKGDTYKKHRDLGFRGFRYRIDH